jgi:type II secretory pathway component GspD/PulD (secretin)
MKPILATCAAASLAAVLLGATSSAQTTSEATSNEAASGTTTGESNTGIPIERIIAAVAHETNRKFLIDPRVQARVHIVGQEPSQVSYNDLLTILELHGFVVLESSGYVRVKLCHSRAERPGGLPRPHTTPADAAARNACSRLLLELPVARRQLRQRQANRDHRQNPGRRYSVQAREVRNAEPRHPPRAASQTQRLLTPCTLAMRIGSGYARWI